MHGASSLKWAKRLAVLGVMVVAVTAAYAGAAPEVAAAAPSVNGVISFTGFGPSYATVPDSYKNSAEAGNPGAPWGITAAMEGNGDFVLLTDANGVVEVGDQSNPSAGLTKVTVPSACTSSYESGMAVSPTGSQVVYQTGSALHIANLNGSGDSLLATLPASGCVGSMTWSPDGRYIAYVGSGGVYIVPVTGASRGTITLLDADGTTPSWSADSSTLYEIDNSVPEQLCNGTMVQTSDVAKISVSATGYGSPTPLGVAYMNCEGQASDLGDEFQAFTPYQVAASPDGHSLAVYGRFDECDQPDPYEQGQVWCGEDNESHGDAYELSVVPSSGGPALQSNAVLSWGATCYKGGTWCFGAPLAPSSQTTPNGGTSDLQWSGTASYKLIAYVNMPSGALWGHAFVQFRIGGECTTSVTCGTYGLYPGVCRGAPNTGGNMLSGQGCVTSMDADSAWTHRIVFEVTKQQFNAALSYANSQSAAGGTGALKYQLFASNCMAFVIAVARQAGITLPIPTTWGSPTPGASTRAWPRSATA